MQPSKLITGKIGGNKRKAVNSLFSASSNNFVIFCGLAGTVRVLHDSWEHFTSQDIAPYFYFSYELFLRRVRKLKTAKRALKPEEAKELKFMLETLIDTKPMLYRKD